MGEAVNGPGGYFGLSMQAFDDCLFCDFGLETPSQIVWTHSQLSRQALDSAQLAAWCQERLAEMAIENDQDFETGRAWLIRTLAAAEQGTRSLFEEIVEMIESITARQSDPNWILTLSLQ
jgi:hypothetical protein